jgi:hypothetical protein
LVVEDFVNFSEKRSDPIFSEKDELGTCQVAFAAAKSGIIGIIFR